MPGTQTGPDDPMLIYFTSGTTSHPKLVQHTHRSYPVGHLSTMYFLGLRPGDVHLNISSPGWAKHAWSSFFAPWIAESTIVVYNYTRFDAHPFLTMLRQAEVTSLCAPPTVWRMLIQADLGARPASLREAVGAGEPLNPEVIAHVQRRWGLTIRDGFGQTETTALIGNAPRLPVKPGSMGRPLPGIAVEIVDPVSGQPANEGEICLRLDPPPVNLMTGYLGDDDRNNQVTAAGYYHTGRCGEPRRRRLHHVHRPHRRRVQSVRLQDFPVRAGERAHRAPGGGRGGGGACSRPDAGWPYPRPTSAWRRDGPPIKPPPTPSSPMCTATSRPTNASGGSNSWSSPRRSPARLGVSTCGLAKTQAETNDLVGNTAIGEPVIMTLSADAINRTLRHSQVTA